MSTCLFTLPPNAKSSTKIYNLSSSMTRDSTPPVLAVSHSYSLWINGLIELRLPENKTRNGSLTSDIRRRRRCRCTACLCSDRLQDPVLTLASDITAADVGKCVSVDTSAGNKGQARRQGEKIIGRSPLSKTGRSKVSSSAPSPSSLRTSFPSRLYRSSLLATTATRRSTGSRDQAAASFSAPAIIASTMRMRPRRLPPQVLISAVP